MSEQIIHHHYSRTRKLLRLAKWITVDTIVIVCAYIIVSSVRILTLPSLNYMDNSLYIGVAAITTIASLYLHRVYHIYWSNTSGHSVKILFQAILWTTLINVLINLWVTPRPIPLSVVSVANVLAFGGLVVIRYRSRLIPALEWRWRAIWFNKFPDKEESKERVLIVGAGESGQLTALRLQHHVDDGNYNLIGFIDDDPQKKGMIIEERPVLGNTTEISEIAEHEKIDLIVVAIHNIEGSVFRHILEICEQTSARIKVVPDMISHLNTRVSKTFLRDVKPEDIIGRSIVSHHKDVDLNTISGRVVLVTGAAGSIGSELAQQIVKFHKPKRLIILDNNESGLYELLMKLQALYPDAKIAPALVDTSQYEAVRQIFSLYHPEIVFHAAAYKHVPMLEDHPNQAARTNIGGTFNIAEAAIINRSERFVLISTDKAVNPSSIMGASKRICELLIHALAQRGDHGTLFTAVRFGNVLGSRGSVVPLFNSQIDRGGPITVTDETMTRYFMSISEAVNLVIHAAALTHGDDIFVLKMGEPIRIYDLAERMIRLRGLRPQIDIEIEITGIRPGEKLEEKLHADYEFLIDTQHPGIQKLTTWNFNWNATDFMSSVRDLVRDATICNSNITDRLFNICECDYYLEAAMD